MPRPVHVIGVSLDLGGNRRGVDMGPSAFRIAGLGERLAALGMHGRRRRRSRRADSRDQGVRRSDARSTSARSRASASGSTRRRSAVLEKGGIPLVLGGDHSLAAGSVAATADLPAARGQAARPDLGRRARRHEHAGHLAAAATCTACRSPRSSAPSRRSWRASAASRRRSTPERTVLIGIRNLDEREKERIRESGVHVFTMKDIDRSRHRLDRRAGDRRSPAATPAASTCRSISTSAIRRSRPASARRSRAGSTTAKRTW